MFFIIPDNPVWLAIPMNFFGLLISILGAGATGSKYWKFSTVLFILFLIQNVVVGIHNFKVFF